MSSSPIPATAVANEPAALQGVAQTEAPVVIPPPAKKEIPKNELVRFKPIHCAILLVLAFLLDIPHVVHDSARVAYPVNKGGIVLVTGASTGIGKNATVYLAQKGYYVIAGVRSKEHLEMYKKMDGVNVTAISLDVTKDSDITNALKTVTSEMAKRNLKFAGLVNNAGVAQMGVPWEFTDMADLKKTFDVNVYGAISITLKFLELIRSQKARIINISSGLGKLAVPNTGAYSSSKFALEGFSDSLRRELVQYDVSVTVVEPAYVQSDIHGKWTAKDSVVAKAKEVYPWLLDDKAKAKYESCLKNASPATVTSTAIYAALHDKYPETRYVVANVDGIPNILIDFLAWLLPDRVTDKLLTADAKTA